jgi:hypothetical protein
LGFGFLILLDVIQRIEANSSRRVQGAKVTNRIQMLDLEFVWTELIVGQENHMPRRRPRKFFSVKVSD